MTEHTDETIAAQMRKNNQPADALFIEEGQNALMERVMKRAEAEGLKPTDIATAIINHTATNLYVLLKDDVDILRFSRQAGEKLTAALILTDFAVFASKETKQ